MGGLSLFLSSEKKKSNIGGVFGKVLFDNPYLNIFACYSVCYFFLARAYGWHLMRGME